MIRYLLCWVFFLPNAFANVVGSETQNFNPTTSGLDYVTVNSSETLKPGIFHFGLYANYAVNSLPIYEEENEQERDRINDSLFGGDVLIGAGIVSGWDFGISFPHVMHQKSESEELHGEFTQTGNTDVRLNTKIRFLKSAGFGVATVASTNVLRTNNEPGSGDAPGPTYNLELVGDYTFQRFATAINLGYRWKNPGERLSEYPVEPARNQVIGSFAFSYYFASLDTKLITEIFGSRPVKERDDDSDRLSSSAEAALGLKFDVTNNIAIQAGAGTELIHGASSPDWRAYTGINMAVGPMFRKPKPASRSISKKTAPIDPFANKKPPRLETVVINNVLFEFDSDELVRGDANGTLRKLSDYLNRPPAYRQLVIDGHTCAIGSDQYNTSLSMRRASTIKKWLVSQHGMDPKRIRIIGNGEGKPMADNRNYQGRQSNRRVEFQIFR